MPKSGAPDSEKPVFYGRRDLLSLLPQGSQRVFLDLGCGSRKRAGYLGLDISDLPGVDIVFDLEKGLPCETGSVDGIYSGFFFEHVSDLVGLFKEIFRVCSPGAIVEFSVPYYQSISQYQDPTHKTVITPETMRYFSKEKWYGSDYGIETDFKLLEVEYHYFPPFSGLSRRSVFPIRGPVQRILKLARTYLWNVVHSVSIKLEAVK